MLVDAKVVPVAVKHASVHGHYALAIKFLLQEEGSRKKDVEEQIIEVQ